MSLYGETLEVIASFQKFVGAAAPSSYNVAPLVSIELIRYRYLILRFDNCTIKLCIKRAGQLSLKTRRIHYLPMAPSAKNNWPTLTQPNC